MPKLSIKATKMSDAQVSFISLVERGANRIPFKIIKQEKPMSGTFAGLDLANLFTRKAEKPLGELVGIVTLKGEGYDSVAAQIAESGFAIDKPIEMEDTSVVFAQIDKAEGDGVIVRVSDDIVLVTKGFAPYEAKTFGDQCRAEGFYPGIRTAMELGVQAVIKATQDADSPSSAESAVASVFDDIKAYVVKMVSALPKEVFKLEDVFSAHYEAVPAPAVKADPAATTAADPAAADPDGTTGVVKVDPDPAAPDSAAVVKTEGTSGDGEEGCEHCPEDGTTVCKECGSKGKKRMKKADPSQSASAVSAPEGLTEADVSAIVATQMEALTGTLAQKFEQMLGKIQKQVGDSLSGVRDQMDELSGQVAKAESAANAANDAIEGLVVGGSGSPDTTPATVLKSETRSAGREIDTALFDVRRRRH